MASLLIIEGAGKGQYHLMEQGEIVSVGRDEKCTIQVLDPQVSRKHLQLWLNESEGRYLARDYRSANGVLVNDHRIIGDTPIEDGDRIRIGSTTMVFLREEHPDAASAMEAVRKRGEWRRSTLIKKPTE